MKTIFSIEKNSINYDELKNIIHKSGLVISEVLSGGARVDVDICKKWAAENHVPVKIFKTNKNADMINNAEILVAVWKNVDGEMRDILSRANKRNLKFFIQMV